MKIGFGCDHAAVELKNILMETLFMDIIAMNIKLKVQPMKT